MHDISIFDETYNNSLASTYNLSIQVLPDGFSFCILDSVRNKFIGLKHFYFGKDIPEDFFYETLKAIMEGEECLTKKHKKVNLLYYTNKLTVIPTPLFNQNTQEHLFRLNHELDNDYILLHNKYKQEDICHVFSIYKPVYDLFTNSFSNINIYNQLFPVIEDNLIKYKNKLSEPKIFVNVNTVFFDIVVLWNNHLKYSNSFIYNNDDDFMYFLMYVYYQLDLDAEKIELVMSGDIDIDKDLFKRISKFVKILTLSKKSSDSGFSYHFNSVKDHYFTALYNINRCV